MSKDFNPTKKNTSTDEWFTPPEIIKTLGPFDLDPCSPMERPWDTALKHYNFIDNGLWQNWEGRVWMNPPYSDIEPWLNKLCLHGDGIALVFARTETKAFQSYVFPFADSIFFMTPRISFYDINGIKSKSSGGAPSVFIAYNEFNSSKIADSNLKGFHVSLTPEMFFISFEEDTRTWRVILSDVMNEFEENVTLSQIYDKVAQNAPKRVRRNKNYKAKVRQTLQYYFNHIDKGVYGNKIS